MLVSRAPLAARVMLPAFLSPFTLFFGYHLFSGLGEYIRAATPDEWFGALPGFVLVLALFLLPAVPSWALLFGRSRLVFDRRHGEILRVLDFRLYRRTRIYRMDQIVMVDSSEVVRLNRASTPSSRTYAVKIYLRDEKPIVVAYEDRAGDAREVAARVAAHLLREVVGPPGSPLGATAKG